MYLADIIIKTMMADRNKDLPEVVAEILIELHHLRGDIKEIRTDLKEVQSELIQQREDHKQHMEGMISTFNTGFTAVIDKLISIDSEMKGIRQDVSGALKGSAELESRVRKLEEKVYGKTG